MLSPDKENLDLFWKFVFERQEIWYKKEVLRQPFPWTSDWIFNKYRFTCIHRKNDTGTKYVLNKIITEDRRQRPAELFFNLIIYRVFNRIATYDFIGYQSLEQFDYRRLQHQLDEYKAKGGTIFTSAFMVTASFFVDKTHVKHHKYCLALDLIYRDIDGLYERCNGARSMQECHEQLASCLGLGDFLSYQIMLDAMYAKILPFDEDGWTVAGAGSRRGLSYIFGELSTEQELEAFRWLRENQSGEFSRLGLEFRFLDGEGISLANIQNSCCEWGKWYKAYKGIGRPRVLYKPKEVSQ